MASYRRRLEGDLDRWITAGLVAAANREPILATVKADRRLDASTALAAIGAILAGAAVIAFVAANWSEIPRVARFGMVLAAFLAAASVGAWAAGSRRELTKNLLLSIAAMVFAAAIGLTGQIFDIAGDPTTALRGAGLGAVLLALAGRAPWPAAVGLLLIASGDLFTLGRLRDAQPFGWAVIAAPVGAALAVGWGSRPLAHAAGVTAFAAVIALPWTSDITMSQRLFVAAAIFALVAVIVRVAHARFRPVAGELYGWAIIGLLLNFAMGGLAENYGLPHAIVWLGLSAMVVALARHDGLGAVTGVGVVSLVGAGAALMFDLGVNLLVAAAVFAGCATAMLVGAAILRRRRTK